MADPVTIPQIIIPGVVGLVTGFAGSVLQGMWAARSKIDESVRTARLERYAKLWRMSELLPEYPIAGDVTYDDLRTLSGEMRDWYFREGGMYLSECSRRKYGDVQDEITIVTGGKLLPKKREEMVKQGRLLQDAASGTAPQEGLVSDAEYEKVQKRLSALRTSMTRDLLARSQTFTFR